MNQNFCTKQNDYGADPYTADIQRLATQNTNFRTAIWTGQNLQMTLMCIPPCGEIGLEIHPDTDQFIRIEQGTAEAQMGICKNQLNFRRSMGKNDAVFIPAGTWHNVINTGRCPLKVSVIYAPPHHPHGTVHRTKADAERESY